MRPKGGSGRLLFRLESTTRGEEAYAQALDIVKDIEFYRRNTNFLECYGLESCALPPCEQQET